MIFLVNDILLYAIEYGRFCWKIVMCQSKVLPYEYFTRKIFLLGKKSGIWFFISAQKIKSTLYNLRFFHFECIKAFNFFSFLAYFGLFFTKSTRRRLLSPKFLIFYWILTPRRNFFVELILVFLGPTVDGYRLKIQNFDFATLIHYINMLTINNIPYSLVSVPFLISMP
jgi:hypothetical protein